MSDVTIIFKTEIFSPPVAALPAQAAAEKSSMLSDFEKVHWWCREPETAAASAATDALPCTKQQGVPLHNQQTLVTSQHCPSLLLDSGSRGALPAPNQAFHVHAVVLCSNSAYFRARITSTVGVSNVGSKRGRDETMEEVLEADECDAAAAVLHFFYTSQLEQQESTCCSATFLLQMMKVRMGPPLVLLDHNIFFVCI